MNERRVLEQRLDTLDALLAGTLPLAGSAAASVGARLQATWMAERRLLGRLLSETPGDNVRATIALWRARTTAFLTRADNPLAAWHDRQGERWEAREVLELLDDIDARLDSWTRSDERLDEADDIG